MKKLIVVILVFASYANVSAWDNEKIHPLITEYAANNFFDPDLLMKDLVLDGEPKKVGKWLQEGSKREDAGTKWEFVTGRARSLNHFHSPTITNPAKSTLETSGLSDRGNGESALLWTQDGDTQEIMVEGDWSWHRVRDYQYDYLTSFNNANADANLARMLMGLGYQMHMIQDMSQPNHVRNNTHIRDGMGVNGFFETWGKNNVELIRREILDKKDENGNYVFPVPDITVDLTAKFDETHNLAPVARLFDTRTYLGTNTPTISLSQGLSEYTNGNFFSQDTIFAAERFADDPAHKYYFPYPRHESTDIQSFINRSKAAIGDTIYISKTGEGENITYFAREGFSTRWAQSLFGTGKWFYGSFKSDEVCFLDQAKKLIPRAVGYSYAMLDYFFRGQLITSIPSETPPTRDRISLNVRNLTSTGENMDGGTLDLMVKFRTYNKEGSQSSGSLLPDGDYQYRKYSLGGCSEQNPSCHIIGTSDTTITFDLSVNPLPPLARDISLIVVYRGKLGEEKDAVAFYQNDLSGITGELIHELPTRGVYSSTEGSGTENSFGNFAIAVRNASPTIPSGNGTTELLVIYKDALSDPFQSTPVGSSENIKYTSVTINSPLGISTESSDDKVFTLMGSGIPVMASDVYAYIIHTTLAGEVTYGYFDISEPTPVDLFNNTDFVCINSQWYQAGTPEAREAADQAGNQNNIDDDIDTYKHEFINIYENNSSTNNPVKASSSIFNFLDPGPVTPASLKRLGYILTDYSFKYSFMPHWVHTDSHDPWTRTDAATLFNGTAFKNQTDPDGTHYYSSMFNMRGISMWAGTGVAYFSYLPDEFTCDYAELPTVQ